MQLPYAMVDPPRPRNELLLQRRGGSTALPSEAAVAALGWGCFRLTFWPRFYNSSSYARNQLEKKMGGCEACLFVQNFGTVLVVIVTAAVDAIFAKFYKK